MAIILVNSMSTFDSSPMVLYKNSMEFQVGYVILSQRISTSMVCLGPRGNIWIRHELKLDFTEPFQVLIEGVVGDSYMSDIGIDDTVFTPECEYYSSLELPSTIITTTTTPKPCPVPEQVHCAGSDICIDQNRVRSYSYSNSNRSICFTH